MSYNYSFKNGRRTRLTGPCKLPAAYDLFHPHAAQQYQIGLEYDINDSTGRKFRYCKAGAAITKAKVIQAAAGTANWQDEIQTNNPSLPTAGDTTITVTMTATATENQLVDAWLTVEQGTGYDEMYLIKSNKAGTANATTGYDVRVTLADQGGIRTAFAVTSNITVMFNKCEDVITAPANPTGVLVGVSLATVTDNYYFWAQYAGPCPITCDDTDTIVVGDPVDVSADGTIPGAVALMDVAADDHFVGLVMRASATSETSIIDLKL